MHPRTVVELEPRPPAAENEAVHPCPGGDFGVSKSASGLRLVVCRPFASGIVLFTLQGRLGPQRSRYSLQLGPETHLDVGPEKSEQEILDHYYWRFLNHSCEPSALVRGRELITVRPLQAGDTVTFDYNTTEWDMAEPFQCHCGSAACLGTIAGYQHLGGLERTRLRGVAPYLLTAVP